MVVVQKYYVYSCRTIIIKIYVIYKVYCHVRLADHSEDFNLLFFRKETSNLYTIPNEFLKTVILSPIPILFMLFPSIVLRCHRQFAVNHHFIYATIPFFTLFNFIQRPKQLTIVVGVRKCVTLPFNEIPDM